MTDTRSVEEVIARVFVILDGRNLSPKFATAAILAALKDEGMVVVPREPTQAMLDDVTAADQREPFSYKTMRDVYRAMISAAEE